VQNGENKDYLYDILNVWPKGNEAVRVTTQPLSQKVDMPGNEFFDQQEAATEQVF
jgi:hypothetical protein